MQTMKQWPYLRFSHPTLYNNDNNQVYKLVSILATCLNFNTIAEYQ